MRSTVSDWKDHTGLLSFSGKTIRTIQTDEVAPGRLMIIFTDGSSMVISGRINRNCNQAMPGLMVNAQNASPTQKYEL